jgi:hypothetical protein
MPPHLNTLLFPHYPIPSRTPNSQPLSTSVQEPFQLRSLQPSPLEPKGVASTLRCTFVGLTILFQCCWFHECRFKCLATLLTIIFNLLTNDLSPAPPGSRPFTPPARRGFVESAIWSINPTTHQLTGMCYKCSRW